MILENELLKNQEKLHVLKKKKDEEDKLVE